ncbi:MAG: serine/threonine protein kinase [Egibacteraceae bacterium]
METVLVQLPSDDDRAAPVVLGLRPGGTVTFGRGAPGCPVGITLPHEGVSRLAGEITAAEDYWLLSNFSGTQTYVVENPEGAGEYVKVSPRRLGAPVPFEFARVVLPVADGFVDFKVFAPGHAFAEGVAVERLSGERTTSAFCLDETAKYFLILVAMCEPRLRDASTVALPTVPEIIDRLSPLESCQALTRAAVNYHIDYLARVKLRVKDPAAGEAEPARLEWKREALVSLAVRFNLVREEHLALLPRRPRAAGL